MRPPPLLFGLALLGCAENVAPPVEAPRVDPSARWAGLLERASTDEGVDYDMIARNRPALDQYMGWIAVHGQATDGVPETLEDKRLSFRLNAYNAAVIYGVLARRPISSVRDVQVGPWRSGGSGFFLGQRFRIDGEWVDLYHFESQYIVASYQEPLTHAALTCAARGCPRVRWYAESKLQDQLKDAMRAYLASERGLRREGAGWAASEIFDWYADDFVDWSDEPSVCAWLMDFAPLEARTWLDEHATDCPLGRIPFDWSLNAVTLPTVAEDAEGGGGPAAVPSPRPPADTGRADR